MPDSIRERTSLLITDFLLSICVSDLIGLRTSFLTTDFLLSISVSDSIDLFEEVTKSQASGWVEAEDYKMPPMPMHFYRLVTLDSFFGHCCFLISFRSVCLQLIGFSEWELLDKYM